MWLFLNRNFHLSTYIFNTGVDFGCKFIDSNNSWFSEFSRVHGAFIARSFPQLLQYDTTKFRDTKKLHFLFIFTAKVYCALLKFKSNQTFKESWGIRFPNTALVWPSSSPIILITHNIMFEITNWYGNASNKSFLSISNNSIRPLKRIFRIVIMVINQMRWFQHTC